MLFKNVVHVNSPRALLINIHAGSVRVDVLSPVPIVGRIDQSIKRIAIAHSCDRIVPDDGVVFVWMTIFGVERMLGTVMVPPQAGRGSNQCRIPGSRGTGATQRCQFY